MTTPYMDRPAGSTQPPLSDLSDPQRSIRAMRSNFLQLQTLISIVLAYQLLFSPSAVVSKDFELAVVLALMLTCATLMILPGRLIAAEWFPGTLGIFDTMITTVLMYLSNSGDSDLYLVLASPQPKLMGTGPIQASDGARLLSLLKHACPGTMAVQMSAYSVMELTAMGYEVEVPHFLQKPFTPETLRTMVQELLPNLKIPSKPILPATDVTWCG